MAYVYTLNELSYLIHKDNVEAGWWEGFEQANIPTKLCLIHSEISEAMEGYRKNLMDDKLPHRKMIEVELADAIIRIMDLAGKLKLDLDGAMADKLAYNSQRDDHRPEVRAAMNGKRF
jgi:NTP pyrophosphatase (non-canonical NTP hydrolase)